jgi:hypothetical protein
MLLAMAHIAQPRLRHSSLNRKPAQDFPTPSRLEVLSVHRLLRARDQFEVTEMRPN